MTAQIGAVFGLLAIAADLHAQDAAPTRRPCVGTVVATDGTPAGGVEVVMVHAGPGGADFGIADRVTATTDARGRFVARLLPNHQYSAWAAGAGGISDVAEGVAAGGDVALALRPNPEFAPIRLGITDPWQDRRPFRVEVARNAQNVVFAPLPDDGVLRLPPPVRARVRDADRRVLAECTLPAPYDGSVWFVLPDRAAVKLRVLDSTGKPLAGAVVMHSTAPSNRGLPFFQPCGTTDANGEFCGTVPMHPTEPWPLFVGAPGHAECLFWPVPGTGGAKALVGEEQSERPGDGFYVVRLRAPSTLHLHTGNTPLASGAEAIVTGIVLCAAEMHRVAAVTPDAAGDAAITLPFGTRDGMLQIRTDPGAPWQLLRLPRLSGGPIDVDLEDQRPLRVQFLDETGGPARGLAGVIANDGGGQAIPFATDQAGHFECTIGPGSWQVFAADAQRFASGVIDELTPTLRTEAFLHAHLVLHDGDGKPLLGIPAHGIGTSGRGVRTADAFLANCMRQHLDRIAKSRFSDREGRIDLPFPKPDFPLTFTVHFFRPPYRTAQLQLNTEDASIVVMQKFGK